MRAGFYPHREAIGPSATFVYNRRVAALILLSHGSVLCGSEQNLPQIARRIGEQSGRVVEPAFLNYTQPDFASAVARCVARGSTEIDVLPYFLIAGKFVTSDLPELIDQARAENPLLHFRVARPIGYHLSLADVVLSAAGQARPPQEWLAAAVEAARFCRGDRRCPLFDTENCAASSAQGSVL